MQRKEYPIKAAYELFRLDGRKVLLSKPAPNPQRVVNNVWLYENPQRRGFVNGLYYPFVTANGNIDIGAGIIGKVDNYLIFRNGDVFDVNKNSFVKNNIIASLAKTQNLHY